VLQGISDLSDARRVVIKVGSSSITGANSDNLDRIVDAVAWLAGQGVEVVLVSSGAIATAAPLMGLTAKSDDLATSQALAGIGQARLMTRYQNSFERHELMAAQMLLTVDNLDADVTRTNALRALERLLELGVVPVVNENDSVATQEIRFGDNDQLASRVALIFGADLLILLSDVDALYNRPPSEPGAEAIERVPFASDLSGIQVSGTSTGYGTGGALTKLAAAQNAAAGGVAVMITKTENVSLLGKADFRHTWFEPAQNGARG
jgi:glutamate 5-kinase